MRQSCPNVTNTRTRRLPYVVFIWTVCTQTALSGFHLDSLYPDCLMWLSFGQFVPRLPYVASIWTVCTQTALSGFHLDSAAHVTEIETGTICDHGLNIHAKIIKNEGPLNCTGYPSS